MSLSQKEAVYVTVKSVIEASYGPFQDGMPAKTILKELNLRERVREDLILGMKERNVGLKKTYDEAKLHVYASSLLTNWLKRDARLGGKAPEAAVEQAAVHMTPAEIEEVAPSKATFDQVDGQWVVFHGDHQTPVANRQAAREMVRTLNQK